MTPFTSIFAILLLVLSAAPKIPNFDRAIPAIMDIQGVPMDWISTDEEVMAKEQEAQQNAADQKNIQAAPAAAAMIKAQVAASEAGLGADGSKPQA